MSRKPYPTDLTDAQWDVLEPLLPPDTTRGHPRTTDLREVVKGILYVLRGGIPWRMLPHDLPPWGTLANGDPNAFRPVHLDGPDALLPNEAMLISCRPARTPPPSAPG